MREHLKNRARLLSYVSAGLVGFGFGVGSLVIGGGAFVLAIIFDLISGALSGKIEQNKNFVQCRGGKKRQKLPYWLTGAFPIQIVRRAGTIGLLPPLLQRNRRSGRVLVRTFLLQARGCALL